MGLSCCKEAPIDFDAQVELEHFQLLRSVGKGAFGKVQIVQHRRTRQLFALKYINKEKCVAMHAVENILQERALLEELQHPFLCNLRYAFQDDENLFMVLDLELGGDLRFHLSRDGSFSEDAVRFYVAELSLALDYLHETCRVIHRDIKPDNILLDDGGHAHLTDFNIAVKLHRHRLRTSVAGSPAYMAPEIYARTGYGCSVDWWSLGVLAFELLTGRRPFVGKTSEQLAKAIMEEPVRWPSACNVSADARALVEGLLSRNVRDRLGTRAAGGLAALRAHPWLAPLDFARLAAKKISPPFRPNSKQINFDATHELEEVLLEDNPLRVRPRRRRATDASGAADASPAARAYSSPEMARWGPVLEAQFRPYDYSKPRPSEAAAGASAADGSQGILASADGSSAAGSDAASLPPPKPSERGPLGDLHLRTVGSNCDSPNMTPPMRSSAHAATLSASALGGATSVASRSASQLLLPAASAAAGGSAVSSAVGQSEGSFAARGSEASVPGASGDVPLVVASPAEPAAEQDESGPNVAPSS